MTGKSDCDRGGASKRFRDQETAGEEVVTVLGRGSHVRGPSTPTATRHREEQLQRPEASMLSMCTGNSKTPACSEQTELGESMRRRVKGQQGQILDLFIFKILL